MRTCLPKNHAATYTTRGILAITVVVSLLGAYVHWVKRSLVDGWQHDRSVAMQINQLHGRISYRSITPRWLKPLLSAEEAHIGDRIWIIEFSLGARGCPHYTETCVSVLRNCSDSVEVHISGSINDQTQDRDSAMDVVYLEHELPHLVWVLTEF